MTTPTWIAELRVILVHPDGRRVSGHIAVGQPYALAGGDPAASFESHCPIEIDGLYSVKHPLIGAGTLQALTLGLRTLGVTLQAFLESGGRVLDPGDGSDVALEAIFGTLLRGI